MASARKLIVDNNAKTVDLRTVFPLYSPANSVMRTTAVGPSGAVQYTNGAGRFMGNSGLVYDGSGRLTNGIDGNYFEFDSGNGDMLITTTTSGASGNIYMYANGAPGGNIYLDGTTDGVIIGASGGGSSILANELRGLSGGGYVRFDASYNTEIQGGLDASGILTLRGGTIGSPGTVNIQGIVPILSTKYLYNTANANYIDFSNATDMTVWGNGTLSLAGVSNVGISSRNNNVYIDPNPNVTGPGDGVYIGANGCVSSLFTNKLAPLSKVAGLSGQLLGVDNSGNIQWQNVNYIDAGIQNRLQIVPTLSGQLSSTILFSTSAGVGSPSSWVPFNTEAQPLSGGTQNGWRNFRETQSSGITFKVEWFPYNPYYGVSLPYTTPTSPSIPKKNLQSLWAVITTKNKINTQGQVFFNVYTYDTTNPPAASAPFTNRWDYSIATYPSSEGVIGSTTTLNGGFRYLLCAVDEPKIVAQPTITVNANTLTSANNGTTYTILVVGTTNWVALGAAVAQVGCVFVKIDGNGTGTGTATTETYTSIQVGNGQFPTQTTFVREPYDIYTTIPHVPFSAVFLATNTPTTPYAPTFDPTTVPISAICISTTSSPANTTTLDWTVEKIGFSANNGAINYNYTLTY
jgi:hypothetical protein